MYPPVAPEARSARRSPGWRGLLVATAALGAVPLVLWAAANPVAGAGAVGGVGCAVVAAVRLVRRHASDPEDRDGSFGADAPALSAVDGRPGAPPANARR